MGVQGLRDRTGITRLMIAARLSHGGATLSGVAQELGVTVQAVSVHAQHLARDGWIAWSAGVARVTPKGLQGVHEGIRRLREALGDVAQSLDVIHVTSALAARPIASGAVVGLFMEEGDLVARPGAHAASRGRALFAARQGEEAIVADLEGLVQLEPGRLTVLSLPAPAEGGIARVDRNALDAWLQSRPPPAKVAAHGTGARILARTLSRQGLAPALEFAADRAAFNAAERGLDVLLLVSRDRLGEVMAVFERLNQDTLRRVPIELAEAGEIPAAGRPASPNGDKGEGRLRARPDAAVAAGKAGAGLRKGQRGARRGASRGNQAPR